MAVVSKPATSSKKTKQVKKEKAPKKTSKSSEVKSPAPEPAVVESPLVENTVKSSVDEVPTIETSMTEVLSQFSANIQSLTLALASVKNEFKALERHVLKEARTMDKVNARRNKNKGLRAPSGFVKPAEISPALAKFLGVAPDTKMARTDVTKMITAYVKQHSLQDKNNGRRILPDTKLKALLKVGDGEEVTYFNLQKYMKPHFVKSVPAS